MPRLPLINSSAEYPHGDLDRSIVDETFALFRTYLKNYETATGQVFGETTPIPTVWATFAHDPRVTSLLYPLVEYIYREMAWSVEHAGARELLIQALNVELGCEYSFLAHVNVAAEVGVPPVLQAAIPFAETSELFDDEQRDVVRFAREAVRGGVSDDLFERVRARYGDQQTVQMITAVAFWSFFAIFLNTARPPLNFGVLTADVHQ